MEKNDNQKFMHRALELADVGANQNKGGPFGAVVVEDGKIIGEAWNAVSSTNDPTGHAEIRAIREACQTKEDFSLEGCTLYTSCEPCPMCFGAIYWARLERIFYAFTHEDASDAGFDDSFIYEELKTEKTKQKIPFEQLDERQYRPVFEQWKNKDDKIEY